MNKEHQRWFSPNLGRDMELLVYGYSGARVLVFPTSKGRYVDWENQGMVEAMAGYIDRGDVQLYCVDSVDDESWYARWKWPGDRAWRQTQYDQYIAREVIPHFKGQLTAPHASHEWAKGLRDQLFGRVGEAVGNAIAEHTKDPSVR